MLAKNKTEQETDEEDGCGAKHDSQIFMQVRSRQVPRISQRHPRYDNDADDDADGGSSSADAAWHDAQEEQSQHTAGKDAAQYPPRVDDALHAQHQHGHDTAQSTNTQTAEAQDEQIISLTFHLTPLTSSQRLDVVSLDNGGRTCDTG